MKTSAVSFVCGIVFAVGLGISGMTQPGVVTAFLDFTGNWNPSLIFVMCGAILVYSVGSRLTLRRAKPVLCEEFDLPSAKKIDRRLVAGSILFGIGWGLAGFCPGPAITSLASIQKESAVFALFMVVGMLFFQLHKK